jgi:dihydroorotase
VLFDPDAPWIVDKAALASRSKNTPFDEARLTGRVVRTLIAGRTVFADPARFAPPAAPGLDQTPA